MTQDRLSSETIHASTVANEGRAVVIGGPSGSGKSDLALRLVDRGFMLVSDDQTIIRREGDQLIASPPHTIAGKLEVRGIGIVEMEHVANVPVALYVDLVSQVERMPEDNPERIVLGLPLPVVGIEATAASAAAKVVIALHRLGLRLA